MIARRPFRLSFAPHPISLVSFTLAPVLYTHASGDRWPHHTLQMQAAAEKKTQGAMLDRVKEAFCCKGDGCADPSKFTFIFVQGLTLSMSVRGAPLWQDNLGFYGPGATPAGDDSAPPLFL